ncbi:MAG: GNAT family N-acetyltransferase, partial [Clostridiales bacterium]|nr:GNAT family N-acetyltransferase [Clostridiales bacterium]
EEIVTDTISIGDYVLTGGELPAMVLVDAVARMVPGVLSNEASGERESFEGNLLEYPQYSRPEVWNGKRVPEVLLSGDKKRIDAWRLNEAVKRTKERRPDLYERYARLQDCSHRLKKQKLLHIGMTELIARGQAKLIYENGDNICLKDKESGIYFLTAVQKEQGIRILELLAEKEEVSCLALHQECLLEPAKDRLQFKELLACYQAVYTRKEKLPATKYYSTGDACKEDKESPGLKLPQICRLSPEYFKVIRQVYRTVDDADYIRDCLAEGRLYGAFFEDVLMGFIGMHKEGCIGMLEVLPQYRRRGIARALEVYMINLCLAMGYTPYGQIELGNDASQKLAASLGLVFSKTPVWFLEK